MPPPSQRLPPQSRPRLNPFLQNAPQGGGRVPFNDLPPEAFGRRPLPQQQRNAFYNHKSNAINLSFLCTHTCHKKAKIRFPYPASWLSLAAGASSRNLIYASMTFDISLVTYMYRWVGMIRHLTEFRDYFFAGFLRKDSSCDPDRGGFPSALPDPSCPCAASPGSRPSNSRRGAAGSE